MFESPTKFLKTLDSRDFDELISIKDDLNYLIDDLEHEIREPEDFRTEHDLPLKVAYVRPQMHDGSHFPYVTSRKRVY